MEAEAIVKFKARRRKNESVRPFTNAIQACVVMAFFWPNFSSM
jgi:hypothetical protein